MSEFPAKGSPELEETRPNFPDIETQENNLAMVDGLAERYKAAKVVPRHEGETAIVVDMSSEEEPDKYLIGGKYGAMIVPYAVARGAQMGYLTDPTEINLESYDDPMTGESKTRSMAQFTSGVEGQTASFEIVDFDKLGEEATKDLVALLRESKEI